MNVQQVVESIRTGEMSADGTYPITGSALVQIADRIEAQAAAVDDGALALSILRKLSDDYHGCVLVGHSSALIDTSWFDITEEEAELLKRIGDDGE